jgi:hypothetical protein
MTTTPCRRCPSLHGLCVREENTMKKIKKLGLQRETVRVLDTMQLEDAAGGLSGNNCSYGLTGCLACPPQRPSLRISNCRACQTDVCTFE